jgi:hypothetical protein
MIIQISQKKIFMVKISKHFVASEFLVFCE